MGQVSRTSASSPSTPPKPFMQALTAENVLASAQRKLDSAKLNLDASQARASAGLASTNDVTKAELQLGDFRGAARERARQRAKDLHRAVVSAGDQGGWAARAARQHDARGAAIRARPDQPGKKRARSAQPWAARAETRRPDLRSLQEKNAGLEDSANEPLYRLIPTLKRLGANAPRASAAAEREGRRRNRFFEPQLAAVRCRGSGTPIGASAWPSSRALAWTRSCSSARSRTTSTRRWWPCGRRRENYRSALFGRDLRTKKRRRNQRTLPAGFGAAIEVKRCQRQTVRG